MLVRLAIASSDMTCQEVIAAAETVCRTMAIALVTIASLAIASAVFLVKSPSAAATHLPCRRDEIWSATGAAIEASSAEAATGGKPPQRHAACQQLKD